MQEKDEEALDWLGWNNEGQGGSLSLESRMKFDA